MSHLLITPKQLAQQLPSSFCLQQQIARQRDAVRQILRNRDPRLLVIVGPCSIHDEQATMDYAARLAKLATHYIDDLSIVMRTYFEKPRTQVGWKGLLRDPFLDESYDSNAGLRLARQLLLAIAALQLPVATEFLDPFVPHYLEDLITWAAIGARTTESQIHRELASGLSMPVGFKNTTDGNIQTAIDAIQVAARPQHYFSINENGLAVMMTSSGNRDGHIVLRGARQQRNYDAKTIAEVATRLRKLALPQGVIVDCSHGNCQLPHQNQLSVLDDVISQMQSRSSHINGIMLESFLVAGKQDIGRGKLTYGQSITDSCLSWTETATALEKLALSCRRHRLATI